MSFKLENVKNPKLREVLGDINAKNDQVKAIFDKADDEQKGEATKEQLDEVKKLNKEIETLEQKAADIQEGEEMRLKAEQRRKEMQQKGRLPYPEDGDEDDDEDKGDGRDRRSQRYADARKSLGSSVLNDKDFKAWRESISGTLTSNSSGGVKKQIQSPVIKVKSLITGGSDTSAGALIVTDRKPLVDGAPFKPLTLLDLITRGETGSDLIEYARITGYTNNAAAVAEATAVGDGSGGKPESGMDLEIVREAVRTIAHWIPATNRALADALQLRTLIDTFLRFGLLEVLEALMLAGDGQGENFLGIVNTPGIQTQAYTTDIVVTTRKARTKCKKPGRVNPTAYVMSPEDWEAFDLLTDGEDRYIYGGPSVLGNPRLWGLPVVENESINTGRSVVADWRYAVLWDRMETMISVFNQHADFATRNLVAILAELRAGFGVLYPKAFVDIDLTA